MPAEDSSVVAAAVATVAALRVGTRGVMVVVGYDYSTRLRLLYKATTTIQGYKYYTRLRTTIQGYNYSTRLRLLYKATTTKVSPLGRYPHSQKCIFFAPGKVPEISENPYFSSPRRSPRFPKIYILGPWGGPQSFESPYVGPPGRSPGFPKNHIFL